MVAMRFEVRGPRRVQATDVTGGTCNEAPTISLARVDDGTSTRATVRRDSAWARYCRVILCTNEFVYVD